tara:strand:- start:1669 stop:1854 length:186 start_codon:yes stop_codon:yes gene_type:complete
MEPWSYQGPPPPKKSLIQTAVEASVVLYAAFAISFVAVVAETGHSCLDRVRKIRGKKDARS